MSTGIAMQIIRARRALTPEGWQDDVTVSVNEGRIAAVAAGGAGGAGDVLCGTLLPAPCNLHSHAFQRAMAGITEMRGPEPRDTFWTWRQVMYRFLDHLAPDDVQAITARAFMEMLEGGFAAVGEFHYLHHRPGGLPYDDRSEMARRVAAAAAETGLGLCLLPVLYSQGGCDGRALGPGQVRFGNDPDGFARLAGDAAGIAAALAPDAGWGVAPHSLRAVPPAGLAAAVALAPDRPLHIHAAEQVAEVAEVEAALGARPVDWLLDSHDIGRRWCLIHATQMTGAETLRLAATGAVAGLCPVTESSLGDGIFPARAYLAAGGRIGLGTDSNIDIGLAGELRTLEYSQRLAHRERAVLADHRSTGRRLWEEASTGGAQALGRASGAIAPGLWADLVALDDSDGEHAISQPDQHVDAFAFAGGRISDVWSAGRHVVTAGRHHARDGILARYRAALGRIADRM
jgi:formimidoylglutamate deiminase